ncbi:MAG TPA: class I SAM-dependent methyltransferase [Terracidiphilus sp.]|nr:class I SAM-dependent methyltransferase [Terracidiphilus sp.]
MAATSVHPPHRDVPNFNGLAALYRWMEYATFGPWLWWCRCTFLAELRQSRRALVLGDGDGRFTARLLANNAMVRVDAVDGSASMLRSLRRRAGPHASRVAVHCTDARLWRPASGPYDLVVTHFFLDCLTTAEVRSLAERLRCSVAPDALWLISEFAVPQSRFGRWIARPIIALLYRAFGVLTGLKVRNLPDYFSALCEAGFTLNARRRWLGGLLVSELWSRMDRTPVEEPRRGFPGHSDERPGTGDGVTSGPTRDS